MEKYGTDKPDLRFDLELTDVSNTVVKSEFGVFKQVVEKGGIVKCVVAAAEFGRKSNLKDFVVETCFTQ